MYISIYNQNHYIFFTTLTGKSKLILDKQNEDLNSLSLMNFKVIFSIYNNC